MTAMDAREVRVLHDIETYGCHVVHVLEDEEHPPFSYSVGIGKMSKQPEVIVVGLARDLAHFVVNEYNARVRAGETFAAGKRYDGFLDGHAVEFEIVDPRHYHAYLGWNQWLYEGDGFDALQIVYPSTDGEWPWDDEVAESFAEQQPLITAPRH